MQKSNFSMIKLEKILSKRAVLQEANIFIVMVLSPLYPQGKILLRSINSRAV